MSQAIQTVPIRVQPSYEAAIGPGLLSQCGPRLRNLLGPCRAAVISDTTVSALYLPRVQQSLEQAGFTVSAWSFPAGERQKTLQTLSEALEFLAREELTRSDCVVALGGGVVGDLAGFAAGCYLRGIPCVQLPTTLLAAVDSSVGGKTGVDLAAGKNLAGLFVQPAAVLFDTECLATLPPAVYADGAAEAVKTGVLAGGELAALLEGDGLTADPAGVIARCVSYKAAVVERDPREAGERKLLNLGHTVGHAIELCSAYAIPHGHAVAAGLAIIARAAEALGWTAEPVAGRITAVLERYGLPVGTEYAPGALARAAASDKKRRGDTITLAVPRAFGGCILKTLPLSELESVIAAGWEVV